MQISCDCSVIMNEINIPFFRFHFQTCPKLYKKGRECRLCQNSEIRIYKNQKNNNKNKSNIDGEFWCRIGYQITSIKAPKSLVFSTILSSDINLFKKIEN